MSSTSTMKTGPSEVATVERTDGAPTGSPRFDILEHEDEMVPHGNRLGVVPEDFENLVPTIHGKANARREDIMVSPREYSISNYHGTFSISEAMDTLRAFFELKNGAMAGPTDARPGSAEKLAVLSARYDAGERLWHPLDRTSFER